MALLAARCKSSVFCGKICVFGKKVNEKNLRVGCPVFSAAKNVAVCTLKPLCEIVKGAIRNLCVQAFKNLLKIVGRKFV